MTQPRHRPPLPPPPRRPPPLSVRRPSLPAAAPAPRAPGAPAPSSPPSAAAAIAPLLSPAPSGGPLGAPPPTPASSAAALALVDVPQVFPFEGGSPQAYAALSRSIEESLVAFSRSAAESQQRIEQRFGAVGLDFTDPSQRYEARVKLQRDLALLRFYTSAVTTLGEAVSAESDFRSKQVGAHIQSVKDLGAIRAALSQLSSLAPGSTPDSPYALVTLEPASVVLTRARKAHPVTVRSHATGVVVDAATFAIPSGPAPFRVDASGCSGVVLAIGETCVLLVLSPEFPAEASVPSGVMRVSVSVPDASSDLAQQVPIELAPLAVPPEFDDRLRAVEAVGPALEERNDARMEALALQLVSVIDDRLGAFQTAVDAVHKADESARRQIVLQAQESAKAREALSAAFVAEMAQASQARDDLTEALAEVASALAEAERVRTEERDADRAARDALGASVASLNERLESGGFASGSGALAELTGRIHDLENLMLLGTAPSVGAAAEAPLPVLPLVERIHILSLVGEVASLYIEGVGPGDPPVRVSLGPGAPLPQPGWTLAVVDAGAGRIEIASPSGQRIPVFPRSFASAAAARSHDSAFAGDAGHAHTPAVGITQVLRPGPVQSQ